MVNHTFKHKCAGGINLDESFMSSTCVCEGLRWKVFLSYQFRLCLFDSNEAITRQLSFLAAQTLHPWETWCVIRWLSLSFCQRLSLGSPYYISFVSVNYPWTHHSSLGFVVARISAIVFFFYFFFSGFVFDCHNRYSVAFSVVFEGIMLCLQVSLKVQYCVLQCF